MNALSLPHSNLTDDEANFVYNVEILELPTRKAAELAGMPASKIYADHVKQARDIVRAEINAGYNISKADVVRGYRDAVDRARLLGEPMTELVGWEKIAKILGYDTPQKIDINISSTIEVVQSNLRSMSDQDLSKLVGANDVIDAEFYEVTPKKA